MSAPAALLWQRDEQALLPMPLRLEVTRLSWALPGGPARARMQAGLTPSWGVRRAAEWAETLLRCPLWVVDEHGDPCWWGYVHAVEVRVGQLGTRLSLDDLANRVAAVYRVHSPPQDWLGEAQMTPWAEDARSQATFGVKERLLDLGAAAEGQALAARTAVLRAAAWPQGQVQALARPTPPQVRVEGRGWWETLSWVHVPRDLAFEGFTCPADTAQTLGRSSTESYVAQSFRLESGPQVLAEAVVYLSGVGSPGDGLTLSLCQDAGGVPGTVLASASLPPGQIYSGRAWVRFPFAEPPSLQPQVTYWLRLGRNGAFSTTAYYRVSVDDYNPYPRGQCLIFNGSGWVARAGGLSDWLFYLNAVSRPEERLTAWLAGAAGQFLRRVEVRTAPAAGPLWPQDGLRTCAAALGTLLAAGDAAGHDLSARVTLERALVVEALPEAGPHPAVGLDARGGLVTPLGAPWPLGRSALGEWAQPLGDWPLQPLRLRHLTWQAGVGLRVCPTKL